MAFEKMTESRGQNGEKWSVDELKEEHLADVEMPPEARKALKALLAKVKVDRFMWTVETAQVVASGAEMSLFWTPCVAFKPYRMTVPERFASSFTIGRLEIGRDNVNLMAPVSAELFSSKLCADCAKHRTERLTGLHWPSLYPGVNGVVGIKNISDKASHFSATFEGLNLSSIGM